MGVSAYPLLSALFAPVSATEFLHRVWPAQPLEVHGGADRLPPVLRDPALASAAELAQRYNGRVRFTHGGSDLMPESVNVNAAGLLDMGLTVQFVDLDGCINNARGFCRQLERELGLHEGSVSLSAFAAARDNGLACHYDAAELISVQLVGGKRFHYAPMVEIAAPCGNQYAPETAPFDDLYPQAAGGFPEPGDARFETAQMRPGSVLFLPRGYWHYTSASEDSLSISITVNVPPALRSVLDQLRCLLLQDPQWRRPLYAHDEAGARTRAQELLASLPAIASRISPQDLLDAPARIDWRLAHIRTATRFQRAPHVRMEIGTANGEGNLPLRFVVGGERPARAREVGGLAISAVTVPLLRWIDAHDGGAFTAGEAADAHRRLPESALHDVLRICVQAQFLRLLWYPDLRR